MDLNIHKNSKSIKTVVILFNLGGPSSLRDVESFLFNLFYDRSILRIPNPFRWVIAKILSKRRAFVAKDIYRELGGKSPILENTIAQKKAIEDCLKDRELDIKVFVSMRYTVPRVTQVIEELKSYNPEQIILLPLYPQYSTTTSASSFKEWDDVFLSSKLKANVKKLCCYPTGGGFIEAQTDLILKKMEDLKNFRILFSAHGLPMSIVKSGDPYIFQVEKTAGKIIERLREFVSDPIDFQVCYQSRVGPIEWIGPSTEKEIERCSKDKKNILLVPLSFVSEHSETLFELDIEYKKLADAFGIESYQRVSTVGTHPMFINFLVDTVSKMIENPSIICSEAKRRICLQSLKGCPSSHNLEIV